MKITSRLVSGTVALAMAGAAPAWAESATHGIQAPAREHFSAAARRARKPAPLPLAAADPAARGSTGQQPPPLLQEIVVTGIRNSMERALSIKRFSDTIVDAVVASQIGRLPDVTAIDALQRIPGIQVGRQLGEGGGTINIGGSVINSGYEIRGLPYAETTLNGREVFSATGARTLNLEDIPSSMLAGIEVYKDPTASLIAGGLAGTVNLRTHRPFDFSRPQLGLSAGQTYGDLIGTAKPNFNLLGSDTWHTGAGKVGALIDFSYHDRAYREDGATNNSISTSTTAVPGKTIEYTNGVYNTMFVGDRRRIGFDGVLQWQPTDQLQAYAEVSGQDFTWAQNQYTFYDRRGGGSIAPGSVSLFPGTSDASSITFNDALASTVGAWRTVEDVNRQYSLHAAWSADHWIVAGDLSYTSATERLNNPAIAIGTMVPTLTQSTSTSGVTTSLLPGFDMTNIANFRDSTAGNYHSYYYDTEQHFRGGETAASVDVTDTLERGFLTSVQGGLRVADRKDAFNQWSTFDAITSAAIQANAGSFNRVPLSPFFSAISPSPVIPPYTVFNPGQLHYNQGGVQQAFGIKPPVDDGSQDYHVDERTYAGYVQLNFAGNVGLPLTGNVGVRLAHHADRMTGEVASGGVYSPAVFSHREVDPLPSLNLTFKLLRDLQWRIAASKVIAYPDFSQIRPSISLLPAQGAASGGNPGLKPTTARQFDTSLEYYFQPGAALTADIFYKSIHDFWLSETRQNAFTIGKVRYNLTGAVDGGNAAIKGAEFGYQQFFRNLPAWLSGLGVAANYTYIKAAAPTAVAGVSTTLPGLSNNSYNLIGIYEKGPVSFRLAYNRRSAFYSSLYAGSTAQLAANPIYTKAYGWLDAALEYAATHNVQVYVDGSNLLRTKLITYYGVPTLPQGVTIDDREVMAGVHLKF